MQKATCIHFYNSGMKNSNYVTNKANHSSRRGAAARSMLIPEDCWHRMMEGRLSLSIKEPSSCGHTGRVQRNPAS
jgi:hypothetical protein